MPRFRIPLYLGLLLLLAVRSSPALGQDVLLAEGMITPKDATTAAEIVVVQVRTADQAPGPPAVVSLDPPRLALSSQGAPTGNVETTPFPQTVGKLAAGTWQVYAYGIDWTPGGGAPGFEGFSGPASFHVGRGEVYPKRIQPLAGQPFLLTVDGPWSDSCVPQIEQVSIEADPPRVVVGARHVEACAPANDTPTRFRADVPVAPLDAGRYEVEVRMSDPDDQQGFELYARASFRVVPEAEPRIVEIRLETDRARDAQLLVVEAEIPTVAAGNGCSTWSLHPRNAWVHGRDLYARIELEQVDAASGGPCGGVESATYRLPLPDLENGLYRVLVQREQQPGSGTFELWAQSPTLLEGRRLVSWIHQRFRITATWRDPTGRTGQGFAVTERASEEDGSSAVFAFFGEDNWELLVKVLRGCALNGYYWVFASAATDVEYTLEVVDDVSGAKAVYRNEIGRVSPAFTDTTALPVCEDNHG
jgi:hypothetical protein